VSLVTWAQPEPNQQQSNPQQPSLEDLQIWHSKAVEAWEDELIEIEEQLPEDIEVDWGFFEGLAEFSDWLFNQNSNPGGRFLVYLLAIGIIVLVVFLILRAMSKRAVTEAEEETPQARRGFLDSLPPVEGQTDLGLYLENLYLYFIDYLSNKDLLPASAFLTNREIRQGLRNYPRERDIFLPLSRMSEEVLYGHKDLNQSELSEVYSAIKDLPS
jgi:hypothetical protein